MPEWRVLPLAVRTGCPKKEICILVAGIRLGTIVGTGGWIVNRSGLICK